MSTEAVLALARYMPEDKVDDACQLLRQDALPKLTMMAAEIADVLARVPTKPLETDADEGRTCELVSRATVALKELDALRRKHVDPLNNEVKAINSFFKVLSEPCEAQAAKNGPLDRLILTYRAMKRQRIARKEEEARRLQEEAARKEGEALRAAEAATTEFARRKALAVAEAAQKQQASIAFGAPMPMTKAVRTDSGTLFEAKSWVFEIVDPAQVPREFCVPNEKAIRAAIATGMRQLPGVHIYEAEGLTRRR